MEKIKFKESFTNSDEQIDALLNEIKKRMMDGTIEDIVVVGFNRVGEVSVMSSLPDKSLINKVLQGVIDN